MYRRTHGERAGAPAEERQTLSLYVTVVEASPEIIYPTANGGNGMVRNYIFEYLDGRYHNQFSFSAFDNLNNVIIPHVGKAGWLLFNIVGRRKGGNRFINNIVAHGYIAEDDRTKEDEQRP